MYKHMQWQSIPGGSNKYHPGLESNARGSRTWRAVLSCLIAFTGSFTRPSQSARAILANVLLPECFLWSRTAGGVL